MRAILISRAEFIYLAAYFSASTMLPLRNAFPWHRQSQKVAHSLKWWERRAIESSLWCGVRAAHAGDIWYYGQASINSVVIFGRRENTRLPVKRRPGQNFTAHRQDHDSRRNMLVAALLHLNTAAGRFPPRTHLIIVKIIYRCQYFDYIH